MLAEVGAEREGARPAPCLSEPSQAGSPACPLAPQPPFTRGRQMDRHGERCWEKGQKSIPGNLRKEAAGEGRESST